MSFYKGFQPREIGNINFIKKKGKSNIRALWKIELEAEEENL